MIRRIDLLSDQREQVALEALWRAQGYTQAQIDAVDDHLDADEPFDASLREVRAVLAALDALLPQPRKAGPLTAGDAQALRLDLGAEAMALLCWMPGEATVDIALAASGNRTLARRCASAPADALAAAIAAALPAATEPADAAPEASA